MGKLRALGVAVFVPALLALAPPTSATGRLPGEFGVVVDAWHVDDFAAVVGASPTMPMQYESWSRARTLDKHFAEARRQRLTSYMVTWEPWQPVDAALGQAAQAAPQPAYSNARIASGALDPYIRAFAASVRRSGLTVYIRYAHEMNGVWYPWSHDPAGYVAAWRHVVDVFRAEGASNARFVFSANPNLFQGMDTWTAGMWPYWPGAEYVDLLGFTTINFGSGPMCTALPCPGDAKTYPVDLFAQRMLLGQRLTGKPLMMEFNTAYAGRTAWLADLDRWLHTPDGSQVVSAVLSQQASRASAQRDTGNLAWNVLDDPASQPYVRDLIRTVTQR